MGKRNWFTILFLCFFSVFAQENYELQTFIDAAMDYHPSILQAENQLQASENKIGLAKGNDYPNVFVDLNYQLIEPKSEITLPGAVPFSAQLFPTNNYDFALAVNYDLYDFGRNKANIDIASFENLYAKENKNLIKQSISFQVINLYYQLCYLREALKVNKEQQQLLEKTQKINKMFYEQGEVTDLDLINTDASLSQVLIQEESLKKSILVFKTQLLLTTGKEIIEVKKLSTPFIKKPITYRDTSLKNNIETRLSKLQSEISFKELEIAEKTAFPVIMAQAKGGYKNGLLPDIMKLRANYTVGVGVQIPIFNGNKIQIQKKIAQNNIDASLASLDAITLKMKGELLESQENIKQFFRKIQLSEIKILQTEKAVERAFLQYENGEITNLDLLRIEVQMANAKLQKIQYLLNYTLSIYAYKKALGQTFELLNYE
ncbi:TolC family protein [Aureivirga marina]|uniref:TolC family protein n=1 Tax=Aureivirga marina TaxID=1182451 RepID=UPI0018CABBAA|nr:TolC family protein [Aureivirga marina]